MSDMDAGIMRLSQLVYRDALGLEKLLVPPLVKPVLVTFCNPLTVKQVQEDKVFADQLGLFDFVCCDGGALAFALGKTNGIKCTRQSFDGNSLALRVFQLARDNGLKIGLVGTTIDNLSKAVRILDSNGIVLSYHRNGFFKDDSEVKRCCQEIIDAGVNVLIVGMGAPYQERFALSVKESGWKGVLFTCGGYLEQIARSGSLMYYPEWANKSILRAVYRAFDDPGRLLRRYLFDYMPFYKALYRLLAENNAVKH